MKYYAIQKSNTLTHHGIKGMRWGVRRYQDYDGHRIGAKRRITSKAKSFSQTKASAKRIAREVQRYKKGGPAGNQNCQVCTWAMECQFRGMDTVPRPVYSPRDPVFDMDGIDIVKNAEKESIKDVSDVISKVKEAGDGARFYTHVKWDEGKGGHEFITANIKGKPYVIDAQQGLVDPIDGKDGKTYFDSIDFSKSFVARMDNKELNAATLKMNDSKNVVKWDWDKDVPYMKKNDMLSDDDLRGIKRLNGFTVSDVSKVMSKIPEFTSAHKDYEETCYRDVSKGGKGFVEMYRLKDEPNVASFAAGVVPSQRGTGLAKSMMDKAEKNAAALGIDRLEWYCEASNSASLKFAKKCGFEVDESMTNDSWYGLAKDLRR